MMMIYRMWYMFLYRYIFLSFGKAHNNNGKLNDDETTSGKTVVVRAYGDEGAYF